jgi:rod shape-determining protein MreC
VFQDLRSLLLPLLAVLIVAALLIVRFSGSLRPVVADFLSPWLDTPDRVSERIEPDSMFHHSKPDLIRRIEELEARLDDERRSNARLVELERENTELRALLGLEIPADFRSIPARVVAMDPANGMRRFRIDRGSADGIEAGQAVLANGYLIGRILQTEETGRHSSIVVTIIDANCRVSVRVLGPNRDGVLFGLPESRWLAQPRCLVKYLARDLEYEAGMKVVSGAYDPRVPAGLPIGELAAHNETVVETVDNLYRQVYVAPQGFQGVFSTVAVLRRANNVSASLTPESVEP